VLKTGIALLLAVLLAGNAPSGLADNHKKIWACAARGADEEDLWLVSWGSQSYIKLYGNRVWGNHYAQAAWRSTRQFCIRTATWITTISGILGRSNRSR